MYANAIFLKLGIKINSNLVFDSHMGTLRLEAFLQNAGMPKGYHVCSGVKALSKKPNLSISIGKPVFLRFPILRETDMGSAENMAPKKSFG
jgi:hypothetical protein